MAKSKKEIFRDGGVGDSMVSLTFAKEHKDALSLSTTLEAQFNMDATKDWGQYNVRFSNPLGQEFWFSGLNCGYKGSGPRTLIKVLKLIKWEINDEIIFINEKLQIARELPSKKDENKDE